MPMQLKGVGGVRKSVDKDAIKNERVTLLGGERDNVLRVDNSKIGTVYQRIHEPLEWDARIG